MRTAGAKKGPGLLALILAFGLIVPLVPGSGSALSGGPCENPIEVTDLGPACPANGGYWIPVGDGWTFTHGSDPYPSDSRNPVMPAKPRNLKCADDLANEFAIRVIYATASDTPNRYSAMKGEVEYMARLANGFVYSESRRSGGYSMLRAGCKGKDLWVQNAILATPLENTTFGSVINDLTDMGFDSVLAKYWIYFDGDPPRVSAAGTGTAFLSSSSPGAGNVNNQGPSWAATWGFSGAGGASVMLHELGHNLGAVQGTAPNTSGAGHCIDNQDVMCYRDGGSRVGGFMDARCRVQTFDCKGDDYFNPYPKKGSWLSTHWNLAAPEMRFIEGCSYRTGQLTVAGGGTDPEEAIRPIADEVPGGGPSTGLIAQGFSIPKKCRGNRYAASGFVSPPSLVTQNAPRGVIGLAYSFVPFGTTLPDVDACFYKKNTLIRCDDELGPEGGVVPAKATRARVLLKGVTPGIYVFNIV